MNYHNNKKCAKAFMLVLALCAYMLTACTTTDNPKKSDLLGYLFPDDLAYSKIIEDRRQQLDKELERYLYEQKRQQKLKYEKNEKQITINELNQALVIIKGELDFIDKTLNQYLLDKRLNTKLAKQLKYRLISLKNRANSIMLSPLQTEAEQLREIVALIFCYNTLINKISTRDIVIDQFVFFSLSGVTTNNESAKYPRFSWPPPRSSSSIVIPSQFFKDNHASHLLLSDIERILRDSLNTCGYFEKSYYLVPDGFAIVTRIERINDDGTPKQDVDRWSLESIYSDTLSIEDFLKSLFTANQGLYRVIAFIVTADPFQQEDINISHRDSMLCSNSQRLENSHSVKISSEVSSGGRPAHRERCLIASKI